MQIMYERCAEFNLRSSPTISLKTLATSAASRGSEMDPLDIGRIKDGLLIEFLLEVVGPSLGYAKALSTLCERTRIEDFICSICLASMSDLKSECWVTRRICERISSWRSKISVTLRWICEDSRKDPAEADASNVKYTCKHNIKIPLDSGRRGTINQRLVIL